ncbi:MAG: protein kinase [Oscillospiraceae bacterium]|nr:protein kinase [Oscillospiraceae bacterium]
MDKKSNINGVIYDTIEEYTINKFIAVGGESIVFKGEKKSVGRTYALKFRDMDRWSEFFNYELKTLSRLEQCSTSKLAGVIPIIPGQLLQDLYRMIPEHKKQQCINLTSPYAHYFCIVEDYIPGCDLNEYCNGDESKGIQGHTPMMNAPYEEVVNFQRKLLQWTLQFCEIMSHVTEEHRFLHLDIKPENIMITTETESITVIDFGKSMEIKNRNTGVSLNQEFGDNIGVYGTNGFAAPECCDSVEMRNQLVLESTGTVDIRSDIFSFGATLWDCINPQPNLHIKPTQDGYFRRDLFNTPKGYIPELEELIIKCTEKDPDKRFQTYDELKKAALHAEAKLLERDKPRKTLLAFSIIAGLLAVLLLFSMIINVRRHSLTFEIARNNFNIMEQDYTEHSLTDYKDAAIALVQANPEDSGSYQAVLRVAYKDGTSVTKNELEEVLFKCLEYTEDPAIKQMYVDTVMQHVKRKDDTVDAKTLAESISIRSSLSDIDCDGMRLAKAINDYRKDPVGSYSTLKSFKNRTQYKDAVEYLDRMLMGDSNLRKQIADATGVAPEDLDNNRS